MLFGFADERARVVYAFQVVSQPEQQKPMKCETKGFCQIQSKNQKLGKKCESASFFGGGGGRNLTITHFSVLGCLGSVARLEMHKARAPLRLLQWRFSDEGLWAYTNK